MKNFKKLSLNEMEKIMGGCYWTVIGTNQLTQAVVELGTFSYGDGSSTTSEEALSDAHALASTYVGHGYFDIRCINTTCSSNSYYY